MSLNHQFTYPDAHYLLAAEGWLELGDSAAANQELEQITPALRAHPDVLLLRWHLCAQAKQQRPCLALARNLTRRRPTDPRGWIVLAQTFYLFGHLPKAYQTAVSKVNSFPTAWPLLYDAARYSCLLGKRHQAQKYLRLAMASGDKRALKRRALADPDLVGLWLASPDRETVANGPRNETGRR
jgi:hypothetical protein